MRAALAVIAGTAIGVGALTLGVTAATASGDQVCAPLTSGKVDTTGDPQTVTLTAPAGELITGYCVKGGSANQGDGPVYVTLDEPVASITISHPSGKAVSHYSFATTPIVVTPPSDPPVDPSDPAVDPSDPAVDPSDPAVDPSDPAVDPSDPAVQPSDPTTPTDVPAASGDEMPSAAAPAPTQASSTAPPAAAASAETLPRTGFDVTPLLVVGALLAMAGVGLVSRRVRMGQR